ncbi:MAG: hypothetical protein PHQ59_03435 [Candidatus Daviesbacteria bacterium]|nr:hypothetical protein [Candidatus Daviesbacteria bacterium]
MIEAHIPPSCEDCALWKENSDNSNSHERASFSKKMIAQASSAVAEKGIRTCTTPNQLIKSNHLCDRPKEFTPRINLI